MVPEPSSLVRLIRRASSQDLVTHGERDDAPVLAPSFVARFCPFTHFIRAAPPEDESFKYLPTYLQEDGFVTGTVKRLWAGAGTSTKREVMTVG